MDRFFTQHHIYKDLESDELNRTQDDAESSCSSSDGEKPVTRVKSVADTAGPWLQTPMGNEWGVSSRKMKTRAEFKSENTGPKGVLADYKAHKRQQYLQRKADEEARQSAILRAAKGVVTLTVDDDSDTVSDIHHDSENDAEAFHRYAVSRWKEYQLREQRRFGDLKYSNPYEFVDFVNETEATDIMTVVHLYHSGSYACEVINAHLRKIAKQYVHIQFLCVEGSETNLSFSMADVPTLLIYKGGQFVSSCLKLEQRLNSELTYCKVLQLLQDILMLY